MTVTTKRHGVVVTIPEELDYPGVSAAEQQHLHVRRPRPCLDYELDYRGYPGRVMMIPDKDTLWRFQLGFGFEYPVADMIPSPSAYASLDDALDAAIKMFIEGRKLSKGKPQRDVSAMQIAQAEKEARRERHRK